jgi:hypothetical protein
LVTRIAATESGLLCVRMNTDCLDGARIRDSAVRELNDRVWRAIAKACSKLKQKLQK